MEFEMKVQAPQAQPIVFNYEELKEALTTALADYKGRIYTEDTIGEAKKDKAKLNNLKKALSEIYEQNRITEKREAIKSMFAEIASGYDINFITLEKIYNPKWENKTTTDKTIATEITEAFEKATRDLEIISKMPRYAFEATEVYKSTFDISKAIAEGERMANIAEAKKQAEIEAQRRAEEARLRAEEEARRMAENEALMNKATEVNLAPAAAEPTPAEPTYEFSFKVRITMEKALALKDFCTENGIELQRIL